MDTAEFLKPISNENPVGEYLRWEREYEELETARSSEEDTSADALWSRNAKRADWDHVIDLGRSVLVEKSKDLQVVAWMTEAWAHRRGLAGIRDGVTLLRAVQAEFWEKAHPEFGDIELRQAIYEFLDAPKLLPLEIRNVPLTRVTGKPALSYSFRSFEESRKTDMSLKRAKSDEDRALLDGYLRGEEFDAAFTLTPRSFYVELVDEIGACREAIELLHEDTKERWPAASRERPPRLSQVVAALDELAKAAKQLLAKKPAAESDENSEPEDEPSAVPDDDRPETVTDDDETAVRESASAPTSRPRSRSKGVGPLTDADEAIARIVDAAHFLRQTDPANPVSYLILRATRPGTLYRGDEALEPEQLPSPSSDVRQRLYQLYKSGGGDQWDVLLEESEQAVGRPEGCGWLDPQLYSARALENLGHDNAARACKTMMSGVIRDHARWVDAQLMDGTPCASRPVRDWIAAEHWTGERPADLALQEAPYRDKNGTRTAADLDGAPPDEGVPEPADPWDEATALRRSGRLNEAIAVMVQAVRQAATGRERFLRTLQQAELCLSFERPGLALPLFEYLARRIDELQLDQWEEASLCSRVLSQYYGCLKGRDEARAQAVYNRLCQLDAGAAMLLGAP